LNFTRKAGDTGTRGFCAASCRCIADEVLAGSHVLAGHCPPSVCNEDALNSLWNQCVLNKIRGMVEKSLLVEATTRIRPRFCNWSVAIKQLWR
jgi:hypothetical protein